MSLVYCSVMGCRERVREGLKRPFYSKGVNGQALADGQRCWRCRAGQKKHIDRAERERALRTPGAP